MSLPTVSDGQTSSATAGSKDLTTKSYEELIEMMQRENCLFENKNFLKRLPDRGEKIKKKISKILAELESRNPKKNEGQENERLIDLVDTKIQINKLIIQSPLQSLGEEFPKFVNKLLLIDQHQSSNNKIKFVLNKPNSSGSVRDEDKSGTSSTASPSSITSHSNVSSPGKNHYPECLIPLPFNHTKVQTLSFEESMDLSSIQGKLQIQEEAIINKPKPKVHFEVGSLMSTSDLLEEDEGDLSSEVETCSSEESDNEENGPKIGIRKPSDLSSLVNKSLNLD